MKGIGEVIFLLLVIANFIVLCRLGSPFSYRDRGVAAWLWLSSWSALLFDAGFLVAVLEYVGGFWIQVALTLSLVVRLALTMWLIWNLPGRSNDREPDAKH